MRLANAVSTPVDERPGHRERAIKLATGLSIGVENEELMKKRRYTDDGEPIPFPTLAEAEKDILYNLNFLTVGNKIPDVMAARLDGVEETVSTYKGQAVLLDFWATWCGPCIASLPKLHGLDEELPEGEFEILSISVDEFSETVTEFQENKPMPWANWHIGPKSDILKTWAVRGYPTYILVDHNGTIIARQHDLNKEFEALIKSTACGPTGAASC
jgi:thiol-disulfide isomerase/thioredoxin